MSLHVADFTRLLAHPDVARLSAAERRVLERLLRRAQAARGAGAHLLDTRTLGERLADGMAAFGGSWTFIVLFVAVLVAWITLNSTLLARRHQAFDPHPYILLNLLLSMTAALQAPIIMMSQNRQATKDRLDAANDYEVNLRAEVEIRTLRMLLRLVGPDAAGAPGPAPRMTGGADDGGDVGGGR
jgi:uncharacterized membrane protein